MMNFKQEEVLQNIIATLKEKFPEIHLISVEELNPHSFWVTINDLSDEDEQFALDDLMAELTTDALIDYGVNFQFVPAKTAKVSV